LGKPQTLERKTSEKFSKTHKYFAKISFSIVVVIGEKIFFKTWPKTPLTPV
jgi:hypothetical protein